MAKRMLIDAAHPEETRVVVLSGHRLDEFDFETSTKKQIKGNIYLAKVTRVEPSLQAAFVEYGGNRHGFLAFNEIHSDYYRIPVSDRRQSHDHGYGSSTESAVQDALPPDHDAALTAEDDGESSGDSRAGDAVPPESPSERPVAAEARDDDIVYGAPEPGSAGDGGHTPDMTAEYSSPQDGDHDYRDHSDHHDHRDHSEPSDQGGHQEPTAPAELSTAESRAEGESEDQPRPETIETVGGDEIEETQRTRARPYRHYKIQEVIKRRQIMLVQVTKEERGNKGAALTTFLSLAGRYCVLMPNTPRGGGVSRKITSITDRRRLKDLVSDLDVPEGMGVIVRTAGSERSKTEIKRDFEYLMRLWDDIRDLTLKSTAPALIYEEGNLIKRSIRDLYARDIDEVIVDGEEGHHTAKAFMKMLMPSHAKRIKPYRDPTVPLFHRYQVETQIDAIHSPVVQLRSGGYIVINPTEALVAIDVNSGRSTKERNIEETALKTNVEAAEEIARQLRLRDLAGLIVIDFIDMEEHRNQATVERKLKDAMRYDRARIQLGRISPFGLLELSRQRLRPSLLEASTQPCPHCNGTGHIRSTESTALHVLRAIEEEGMRRRSAEITVAVPTAVALYILNQKRQALAQAELRYGFRVAIGSDDSLVPPAFRLERLRALTPAEIAALPVPVAAVPEVEDDDDGIVDEDEVDAEVEVEAEVAAEELPREESAGPRPERVDGEESHGRRRRRRRRRGGRRDENRDGAMPALPTHEIAVAPEADAAPIVEPITEHEVQHGEEQQHGEQGGETAAADEQGGEPGGRKRRRRGRRGGRRRRRGEPGQDFAPGEQTVGDAMPIAEAVEYVPATSGYDDAAAEMAEALHASPAPEARIENGAESVPVAERGDHAPESATPPTEGATSAEIGGHDVSGGSPANPKRGWWRRVLDS
jgi:ribonuclease E